LLLTAFAGAEAADSGVVVVLELEQPTTSRARATTDAIESEIFIIIVHAFYRDAKHPYQSQKVKRYVTS
jgi:hypothetical protein